MSSRSKVVQMLVKIGLIIVMIVLGLIVASIYKEAKQKKQIQEKIDALKESADRIQKDNALLQDKLVYFESRDYLEKRGKELNLQNPDERLVVVRPSISKEKPETEELRLNKQDPAPNIPNYLKWWSYFFKY